MSAEFSQLSQHYLSTLVDDVMPFWTQHSLDEKHGGYFTCLDRSGKVYDTDKFMWLQGRQVWTYSKLYNSLDQRQEWLDVARMGAEFLLKHGRDQQGNWYFSLNQQGQPLVQPYNIFSDCFATMALAQYGRASGSDQATAVAVQTYKNILARQHNPKGQYNKAYPGTRPLKNFALPMILSNLVLELEDALPQEEIDQTLDTCVHEVMEVFYDAQTGLIYENVLPDGSLDDSFDGRLLNPGHGIEAMWFMMDIAERRGDQALATKCADIALGLVQYGWDQDHGGIFYFLDAHQKPPHQLEWDQKLWWVHLEALVALSMGLRYRPTQEMWTTYRRLHDYAWSHFADPSHGEWFGYLNRQGEVLLNLKGGKWKGCFHVPRAMLRCHQSFELLSQNPPADLS